MKAQTRTNPFAQPRPMAPPATESRNIVSLQWTAIRTDGGTQARITIDEETVSEYADAMRKGARFPAIICYYDGETYWLADGFHRHKAHFQAHGTAEKIAAEVRQGTRRDAVLFAVGANSDHGLRRTHADKRNAVLTLLRDEEWAGWSDRQIAERTKTTHPFVGKLRRELTETTGNNYQSTRTGADGRTIDTAKIGANQPTRTSKPITQPKPTPSTYESTQATPITNDDPAAIIYRLQEMEYALLSNNNAKEESVQIQVIKNWFHFVWTGRDSPVTKLSPFHPGQ